jgi:hypothetical protein
VPEDGPFDDKKNAGQNGDLETVAKYKVDVEAQ